MLLNILLWALLGLIAGIVAKYLFWGSERANDPGTIVGTIVLGIAGALLGGFLSSNLFGWSLDTFSVAGFVVAVLGAILLLFLYGVFTGERRVQSSSRPRAGR
jgi:uncharacterized membrane protein YeaQ/YmgE (transglycosylase-associated protein family)